MSGRRRRALARAFRLEHGRPPAGPELLGYRDHEAVWNRSEVRIMKKAHLRARRGRP